MGEKILEEAAEVVDAAEFASNKAGREHLVHEAADLIYHLFVLLGYRNVTLGDVEARVCGVIKEVLTLEDDEFGLDSAFIEDLEAESIDLMMLAIALEEEFQGSLPEDEWEKFKSPRQIISYIEQRMAEASSHEGDVGVPGTPTDAT